MAFLCMIFVLGSIILGVMAGDTAEAKRLEHLRKKPILTPHDVRRNLSLSKQAHVKKPYDIMDEVYVK